MIHTAQIFFNFTGSDPARNCLSKNRGYLGENETSSVADPGFPIGGTNPKIGSFKCINLSKFSEKLQENE